MAHGDKTANRISQCPLPICRSYVLLHGEYLCPPQSQRLSVPMSCCLTGDIGWRPCINHPSSLNPGWANSSACLPQIILTLQNLSSPSFPLPSCMALRRWMSSFSNWPTPITLSFQYPFTSGSSKVVRTPSYQIQGSILDLTSVLIWWQRTRLTYPQILFLSEVLLLALPYLLL